MALRPMKPPPGCLPDSELGKLRFPLYGSPKFDGLRMSVQGGALLSSTLKPIPNPYAQQAFARSLFENFDGEGIVGDPTDGLAFGRSTSFFMGSEQPLEKVTWYIFDRITPEPFIKRRIEGLTEHNTVIWPYAFTHVRHTQVNNLYEFLTFERECVNQGYEGAMFRNPDAYYKHGRATLKGQELIRRKPVEDGEALVIDCVEGEINLNPSLPNELGLLKKSSSKAGKIPSGTLGSYLVKGLTCFPGVVFNVSAFGTDAENKARWEVRHSLKGKILKFKYQRYGSKDAPRQPIGLGFRDRGDM